jgi:hypothetical protein
MATKTEVYANQVLDDLFGSGSPATLYFGLFTSAPAADGTGGTEVTGGSYARAAKTNNATNFPAAAAKEKSNANAITFAQATANWGTITHVVVFDSLTVGARFHVAPLVTPRTINNGDTFEFAATQLVIQES